MKFFKKNYLKILLLFSVLIAVFSYFGVSAPVTKSVSSAQTPENNLMQFKAGNYTMGFEDDGVVFASPMHMLRIHFVEANKTTPTAEEAEEASPQDSQTNTQDTGTKPLGNVTYRNVWEGIDIVYNTSEASLAKSTYRVNLREDNPNITPNNIRLRYNRPVSLSENGSLVIPYDTGTMTESAPIAWQEANGKKTPVPVSFTLHDNNEVTFALGAYDPNLPLVIDPAYDWLSFLGGDGGTDEGYGIAVDTSGNVYVIGNSDATWGSPVRAHTSGSDAFAAKLNSSGVLTWNTFLGGSGDDNGRGIAVDTSGNVYVGGDSTATWGSPVRAYYGSGTDAFAVKLDSSGNLTWHTFLGGSGSDYGYGIAIDTSGNVYVGGYTNATWGTPVRAYTAAGNDAFAAKLNSSGVLTWNTFLGGSGDDNGRGIAVDTSGNVYVIGNSGATWGTPVRAYTLGSDAFAAKLDSSGTLTWNTFLGGSGGDNGRGIAVDTSGNVYVGGDSMATWGTPVRAYTASDRDAFAAKLDSSGNLTWNTFLGGSGYEQANSIAVDTSGNVYVGGDSDATWGTPVRAYTATADFDAHAVKLDSSGNLTWHTFLGGSGTDYGMSIAVDTSGNVYVTGQSTATWGSPVRAYTSDIDGFAAKLNSSGSLVTFETDPPVPSSFSPASGSTITDSTPTITFTTDEAAYCRASTTDESYADMADNDDCTGDGTTSQSCTLSDLGASDTKNVYISCADALGNEDTVDSNENLTYTLALPTPTPTSTTASVATSNDTSSSSAPPVCSDTPPGKAPLVSGAIAQDTGSILLYFSPAADPVNKYVLEYGTTSGDYPYGVQDLGVNSKDQMTFLVKSLSANTPYYFRVRGGNGCATGPWSDEISAKTKGWVTINNLDFVDSKLEPVEETQISTSCQTHTVESGDTLWSIAEKLLGDANKYNQIVEQNKDTYPSLDTSTNLQIGWELKVNCDEQTKESAQGGYKVKIKVTDTEGKPVAGAKVTLHSTPKETTTDKDGIAAFDNVEAGQHRVLIAYDGYQGEQSVNLQGDVKEFHLDVTVHKDKISASPLLYGILGVVGLVAITSVVLLIKERRKK